MKTLKRNQSGKLILVTESEATNAISVQAKTLKPRSPIVSDDNYPIQAKEKSNPKKSELKASLISEEKLLEEMQKAGGKDLTTHQFALLIAPCVKKSEDELRHHTWDQSHSHIRAMMRKLVEQGKVSMELDRKSKKLRYVYNLLE